MILIIISLQAVTYLIQSGLLLISAFCLSGIESGPKLSPNPTGLDVILMTKIAGVRGDGVTCLEETFPTLRVHTRRSAVSPSDEFG